MPTINLRMWVARQGDVEPSVDPKKVMKEVTRIWGKAGVQLVVEDDEREVRLDAPKQAPSPEDLKLTVAQELAPEINVVIEGEREGFADVVLVPRFGQWGQAYTPLAPAAPGKIGTFAPFSGPVVIVATDATRRPSQPEITRGGAAWPLDAEQPPEPKNNPLVFIGIANDVAHELGHLFGLWHTTETGRPGRAATPKAPRLERHLLIYETLYGQATKLIDSQSKPRSEDQARELVGKTAGEKGADAAKKLYLGRDEDWYVALRGEIVDHLDVKIVTDNIEQNKVWRGSGV